MSHTKDIVVSKFKNFCKHSTLHGLYYFHKSSRWTVHLIWGIIVILGLTLCSFLGHMIWIKFVIDPTFTVVESTRYAVSDLPFPAVSLCSESAVYGPNTDNITKMFERRGYSKDNVNSFFESLEGVKSRDYVPDNFIIKMHGMLENMGYPYEVIIDMVKKPCDVLLLECIWRSKSYNCSDMFRDVLTYRGYCCQFDIPYFRRHVKGVSYLSGTETTEGLMVRINTDSVTPTGVISGGSVQLYLFDVKDSITLLDSPITLVGSTLYDVNVDVWAIDSSDNVKALPVESRKCLLASDKGPDFYQGCLTTAILRKVVDSCRCIPFNYSPYELEVAINNKCTWDRLFCVFSSLEDVIAENKHLNTESGCYQKCDNVDYDTNVKYIRQKRKTLRSNFSTIMVHFADNSCMKYRREVLYSWDQMLANLGGIFGLCVGGSMISIIELLWFIIDVIYSVIFIKLTPKKKFNAKDFAQMSSKSYNKKLAFTH